MNFGKNGRSHPCGNFAHRAASSGSSSGANREACGATGSATTSAIAGTYRPCPGKTKVRTRSLPAKRAEHIQIVALAHDYTTDRKSHGAGKSVAVRRKPGGGRNI